MKARSAKAVRPRDKISDTAKPSPCSREEERGAALRLIRTPYIGGVTFWELLAHFGSASLALDALPEFAKHGSRITARTIPTEASIEEELEKAAVAGMTLQMAGDPGYPPLLAQIEAPPPVIYVKGSGDIWNRPPVAVVGSRQASAAGLKLAAEISADLGRQGFLIVSGLARGIDAAAHRATLPYGTCAVLPGGLDMIYPPEHVALSREIAQNGLLLSECAPGFVARSQDFPRRNRIISGSCLGVVVVEAAERSGSLITARLAGEQNREVFAVPGHPFEPRAAGTNGLLKEGAVMTLGAKDVEQALYPLLAAWNMEVDAKGAVGEADPSVSGGDAKAVRTKTAPDRQPQHSSPVLESWEFLGETTREVLKLISLSPIDVDDLCRLSGLETRHVHAALLSLDLSGHIQRRGLRQVVLRA